MKNHNPALLPSGLNDLLPPDSESEARAIGLLMDHFHRFGYRRIRPPLVEFEDSLLGAEIGSSMAGQTFRLMDPASRRMMGIRSDTTQQIARIAATRLLDEPRPLRISYATDVLRIKGSQMRPERQFVQVGCEIIGTDSAQADIESAVIGLEGLHKLGIANLSLDLAFPPLLSILLDKGEYPESMRSLLEEALRKRDQALIVTSGANEDQIKIFLRLCESMGKAERVMPLLQDITPSLPEQARACMQTLGLVYAGIQEALHALRIPAQITIDPLETKGFAYKTGIAYTYFAHKIRGELGRGGRYSVYFAPQTPRAHKDTASSCTLYTDTIRKAMPHAKSDPVVSEPAHEGWKTMRQRQNEGHIVVRVMD